MPEFTPRARRTDPVSSIAAGREIEASGAAATQRELTAKAVADHPGSTTRELSAITGLDRYMLARRTKECEQARLIKRGEVRRCLKSDRPAVVWFPAS